MLSTKFATKAQKALSPRSPTALARQRSPKANLTPTCLSDREKEKPHSETDVLKRAMHTLSEERNLLYEYKLMAVPKINQLEAQLEKTKSLYESEISCMKEYIDILKSSAPTGTEELVESLKAEKSRSLTFYRALMRKQEDCEENHGNSKSGRILESEVQRLSQEKTKISEENKRLLEDNLRLKRNELYKTKELEQLVGKIKKDQQKMYEDSVQSRKSMQETSESEKTKDLVESLKSELKNRMNDCVNQAVSNYNLFSNNLVQFENRIKNIEKNQKYISTISERLKTTLKQVDKLRKEKFESDVKSENELSNMLMNIKTYEEDHEYNLKTIRALTKKIDEINENCENKLKNLAKENKKLKESLMNLDEIRRENNGLKETLEELQIRFENCAEAGTTSVKPEEYSYLLLKLNSLTKKYSEQGIYLQRAKEENIEMSEIMQYKDKKITDQKEIVSKLQADNKTLSQSIATLEKDLINLTQDLRKAKQKHLIVQTKEPESLEIQTAFSLSIPGIQIHIDPERELDSIKNEYLKLQSPSKKQEDLAIQLFTTNEELVEKDREIEDLKQKLSHKEKNKGRNDSELDSLIVRLI